jgi:ADP-heptose:LPS heptosyltransferase
VSADRRQRILVIKLSALGDVIQSLGPMAAIRRHHADAHVTALTTAPFAPLLQSSPYFDDVWVDARPALWNVPGWLMLRRRLRSGGFDRVYDLQTSDRSGFYFRLLGPGRRPEWSGIAPGCSHPHANPKRDSLHIADSQAEQLAMAGIRDVPLPDVSWLQADIGHYALPRPYVLMVLGGSPHRPQKIWPAERFGAVGRELVSKGYTPVLLGTVPERALADAVRALCSEARSLVGKTSLAQIAALARGAAAALGGITGPMHLIAAAGAPSVVLFSAVSDPAQCAPRGKVAILRKDDLADLPGSEVSAALRAFLAPSSH